MIREATEKDVERLVELGEKFVGSLKYLPKGQQYSEAAVTNLVLGRIEGEESPIVVSEVDEEVIGGLGAFLIPLFFAPKIIMASEVFFYLDETSRGKKEGSKIMEYFLSWAEEKGAVGTTMVSMGVTETTYAKETFEKYGFREFETIYRMMF